MRKTTGNMIWVVLMSALVAACGKRSSDSESDGASDTLLSCAVTNVVGDVDLSVCIDIQRADPTETKEACEGEFRPAPCANLTTGTKACQFDNGHGISLTEWFVGKSWTDDEDKFTGIRSQCDSYGKKYGKSTVIAK